MGRLSGEDKLLFITVLSIYTEAVLFIFLIPIIGFTIGIVSIIASIVITIFALNTYKLWNYKRVREEIGGIPFATGWIIGRTGEWRYIDFGIVEKEEIAISDQDLEQYESQVEFKMILKEFKESNEQYAQLIDENNFKDEFVDPQLAQEYNDYGINTSRQIYAFEIIKTLLGNTPDFATIVENLKKVESHGKKTRYLEGIMQQFKLSDKIAYNTAMYGKKMVRLKDVEYISKDSSVIKKNILKQLIPIIFLFIAGIFTIILTSYIKNTILPDIIKKGVYSAVHEGVIIIFYALSIISVIVAFVISLIQIKRIYTDESEPIAIHFNNIITKRTEFENFCEIRKRLKEFSSDARIYKVYPFQKYRTIWKSDYIIMILPSSFQDSLDFDVGNVSHRGYPVEVLTTPIVMLDIGSMFGTIPMYLMIASTYHFRRFTKIFYNYNILQTWKNKVYLHLISTLQTKMNLIEPEKQTLGIRVNKWREFAIEQSQLYTTDKNKQVQELIKVNRKRLPNSQDSNSQDDEEDDEESEQQNTQMQQYIAMKNKQKKSLLAIIGIVILIIILIIVIIGIITMLNTGKVV